MTSIYILRYVAIPLVGLALSLIAFIFIYFKSSNTSLAYIDQTVERNGRKVLIYIVAAFSAYYIATICLKYFGGHLATFDFGIYDHRIWQIHSVPWSDLFEKFRLSLNGHFHPVLGIYSLLYDVGAEPLMLNILQALAVISGIIPLYLIATARLNSPLLVYSITALYLMYPATQFNIAVDFHPDHLIIPLLFWCYYCVEKKRYLSLALLFAAGYCIKEPFLLSFAFMGIYIAWDKKRYVFGISTFMISILFFYVATFIIVPAAADIQIDQSVQSRATGFIAHAEGLAPILVEVLRFEKWRFPYFLLFPVLALPLLRFREFLPAAPLLLLPLFSANIHHQNVASQYTAGIIPPLFIAFCSAMAFLHTKYGRRLSFALLCGISLLLLTFNISHSPSPFAVAFWNKEWSSGKWHYSNYTSSNHQDLMRKAIAMVPKDTSMRIVVHSEVYNKRFTHRYSFNYFPEQWQKADYIFLDSTKGYYVADRLDPDKYREILNDLRSSKLFSLIFDNDGILLFKRQPS